MQHTNNNKHIIAKELNSIILSLADMKTENINDSLKIIDHNISILEQLSLNMDIPELRALTHWMMLNTELENNNETQITALIDNGSYYHWMDILSMLLQNYDQSLLPVIYNALTTPKWIVKPSAPLLRNLATWIDTTKLDSLHEPEFNKEDIILPEKNNIEQFSEIGPTIIHAYKKVVSTEHLDTKNTKHETLLQATDIITNDKKTTITTSEKIIESCDDDVLGTQSKQTILDSTNNSHPTNAEGYCKNEDYSLEIDDIIISLSTISAQSDDIFKNIEQYIVELQRLDALNEISGYEALFPISNWCQENLLLFAKNKSNVFQTFIKTGECWTWIELIKVSILEPEEASSIQDLNFEINRDEWLKPFPIEKLQSLLLFLSNPQGTHKIAIEETTSTNKDDSPNLHRPTDIFTEEPVNLSFKWDADVHPELLDVYFDETKQNIEDIFKYLSNIQSVSTSKEQRQDARRTAHTIKGSSAVVGITALSTYAYQLEKILDYSIENKLSTETNEILHSAASGIKDLYGNIKDNKSETEEFFEILSNLTHCANALENLNDEPLKLSTPILPDFIQQQNTTGNLQQLTIVPIDKNAKDANTPNEFNRVDNFHANDDFLNIENSDITNKDSDSIIDNELLDTKTVEHDSEFEIKEDTSINNTTAQLEQNQEVDKTLLATLNKSEDITDFTAELDNIVMTLITTEVQTDNRPFKLDKYISELERLDMLAEISGYPEIVTISNWHQKNLNLIAEQATTQHRDFITSGESWSWIELISAYLTDSSETSYLTELSNELTRPEWVESLSENKLQALLLALTNDHNKLDNNKNILDKETKSDEHTNKQEKDNIIMWDEDIHPELLSVYLQETEEQVSKIAKLLQLIAKGKASKEQQEQAARIAHTIKGASGVVGINEIVDLTHRLEDILDYAVNNQLPIDTAELLAESSDCLESLFEAAQNKSTIPEEFKPLLTKLTNYAKTFEESNNQFSSTIELATPDLPSFIRSTDDNLVNKNLSSLEETSNDNNIKKKKESPVLKDSANKLEQKNLYKPKISQATTKDAKEVPISESHIRVPIALINKLLNIAGELVTASSQVSDKLEKSIETSRKIKTQDIRIHNMLEELVSTIYKQEKNQMTMLSSMQNNDFDSLEMDTYNELHSVVGLLTESILDSEAIENTIFTQLKDIHNNLRSVESLNKELSETILNSRMESLNTLIPRLERIVRQTCRKTNKEAELLVSGNEIDIDTEILNGLVDPLLHLLRNAIDHGIETPEIRQSKKKNPSGQINLNFSRQGNFILMQLKDDGAGIDSEKIYQQAINQGLITPDHEYTENEVLKLILEPGFSTQTNVTDISGRGVGMDVVNKGIKDLKGSLVISSELNHGTCFNVKIPLTLVTSSSLLVETAGNKVAIPTDLIEQIFYLSPDDVLTHEEKKYIRYNGKEIVIESLSGILGWPVNDVDFSKAHTLLLIQSSQRLHAIYIDQIIHSREVVIKSLAHYIDNTKGVIGACHLSDGEVAPVINLPQLLSTYEKSNYEVKQLNESINNKSNLELTPQILVVDDSLSNRKALSLIIAETEYDVVTAVDGLDALNVMNERHIDLVFTDLEMPRMTGLELTQAIRAWHDKKETPIVMITSRSTHKHRELAKKAGVDDYLTKPVGTDTLRESIETWLKQTAST